MKKIFLLSLIAVGIVVFILSCKNSVSSEKEKTYPHQLSDALDKADMLSLDLKVNDIKAALNLYYTEKGQYPESLDILVPEYLKMESQLEDTWGSKFKLDTTEEMNMVLVSPGKDKIFGTADDIKRRL
jgi:hypothetical protein